MSAVLNLADLAANVGMRTPNLNFSSAIDW